MSASVKLHCVVGGGGKFLKLIHIYMAQLKGTSVSLKEFTIAVTVKQKIFTYFKEFMVERRAFVKKQCGWRFFEYFRTLQSC